LARYVLFRRPLSRMFRAHSGSRLISLILLVDLLEM
jgi:hypothetical protein